MSSPESRRGIGIDTLAVTSPRVDALPMVTIVTVCFGAARTLPRTLDSLRRQRDPRLECLVIDGGSRDGTVALLESSADVVDRYLSEPDRGLYDAMNKGAAMACGRFLWFVNADDWLEAGAVEAVLEVLERCGDEEILLTGDTRRIDASGRQIGIERHRPDVLRPGEPYPQYPHPSTLMPRALFHRLGGFDASLRIVADHALLWQAWRLGVRVERLDRVLVNMLDGGRSSSSAGWRARFGHELELLRVQWRLGSPRIALHCHAARVAGALRAAVSGRPTLRSPAGGPPR
jgi:glycosyltransferase